MGPACGVCILKFRGVTDIFVLDYLEMSVLNFKVSVDPLALG